MEETNLLWHSGVNMYVYIYIYIYIYIYTGEIKYPGQTKTSTAALRLTEGSVKPRGKKPRKKNHLVLQVGG